MSKGRLEAFSDGVIAIIITIMVLELAPPAGSDLSALRPLLPKFLGYILSFIYVGIYWNNHHHLFQAVRQVNGRVLWANLHLLFWLSLVPFVTAWMGQNALAAWPVAFYGLVLLMAAIAYNLMTITLLPLHEADSPLATALGRDIKGKASVIAYIVALPLAFLWPWASYGLFVIVALVWLVPDRRIEKTLTI
jgi:uncharacterized membrane protein